jgi:SAM-dependent methyltransferase
MTTLHPDTISSQPPIRPAFRTVEVEDAEALVAAVRFAAAGDVIRLVADRYDLEDRLSLDQPITLLGADDHWPVIKLVVPDAALCVTAPGCTIRHVVLSAVGHRVEPMLRLIGAREATIDQVALLRGQGSGIEAEDCHLPRITSLSAVEIGTSAVTFRRCSDVVLTGVFRQIGKRAKASAIHLVNTRNFSLVVEVHDASGSAVTVQSDDTDCGRGSVILRATSCFRALAVMGDRSRPIRGFSATVSTGTFVECGVLLCNVDRAAVSIVSNGSGDAPLLCLDGAFGTRASSIAIEAAEAAPYRIEARGGSKDNAVAVAIPPDGTLPAQHNGDVLPGPARWALAEPTYRPFEMYEVAGTCAVCGWQGNFRRTMAAVRETLGCRQCRATLRYRGQAETLLRVLGDGTATTLAELAGSGALSDLRVFEPGITGPLRPYLGKAGEYHQSFYDPSIPSGTIRNGIACQDLMATSHPDAYFDLVVSSDIMEHVRHPFEAFAEIRRILKPGGAHVFTVPFGLPLPAKTRTRVDVSGPEDRHVLPPVYHGSGDGGRSLVYTDFGRDMVEILAGIGLQTQAVRHHGKDPSDIVCATLIARRFELDQDRSMKVS